MRAVTLAALVGTLTSVHGAPIDPYIVPPRKLPIGIKPNQDIGPYGARLAPQQDWGRVKWWSQDTWDSIAGGGCMFMCLGDAMNRGRNIRECFSCDDAPAHAKKVSKEALSDIELKSHTRGPHDDKHWPSLNRGPFGDDNHYVPFTHNPSIDVKLPLGPFIKEQGWNGPNKITPKLDFDGQWNKFRWNRNKGSDGSYQKGHNGIKQHGKKVLEALGLYNEKAGKIPDIANAKPSDHEAAKLSSPIPEQRKAKKESTVNVADVMELPNFNPDFTSMEH